MTPDYIDFVLKENFKFKWILFLVFGEEVIENKGFAKAQTLLI